LRLGRSLDLLEQLQKTVFLSHMPIEPTREMSSRVYLSGSYYSMHDISREAIQYSQDILLKIMNYLKNNPEVMLGDDGALYQAGIFIGKNIQYIYSDDYPSLLPVNFHILTYRGEQKLLRMTELYEDLKGYSFSDEFQRRMIEISNNYKDPFGHGLGLGLAQVFPSLDQETRDKVWNKLIDLLKRNIEVGHGFGEGIAQVFPSLDQETRDKVWNKLMEFKLEDDDFTPGGFGEGIAQVLTGFGEGIAQIFESISETDFENVLILASKNYNEFAVPLGMLCATKLQSSYSDIYLQERIIELIRKNSSFAMAIGTILSESFMELDNRLKEVLLNEAKRNSILDNALSFGRCQFCKQIIKNDFDSFTRHMFEKHYNIVRQNIPNADDIPQECDKCSEIVRSDINEIMKHEGEKHYDCMPENLKKEYDKWKAMGFPKITDYEK
jgi:hypothetical protein